MPRSSKPPSIILTPLQRPGTRNASNPYPTLTVPEILKPRLQFEAELQSELMKIMENENIPPLPLDDLDYIFPRIDEDLVENVRLILNNHFDNMQLHARAWSHKVSARKGRAVKKPTSLIEFHDLARRQTHKNRDDGRQLTILPTRQGDIFCFKDHAYCDQCESARLVLLMERLMDWVNEAGAREVRYSEEMFEVRKIERGAIRGIKEDPEFHERLLEHFFGELDGDNVTDN
ncbi:hypothetical protein K435DRAFT_791090 [Dendrothele bispora CBS 962.96]|uniref:Uncharacterized protein n=1 Tax=Dendrothele bispora (strain CBS 962.96) TaxID=1314807 RepID=A0A4S8MN36_DENBC|nr:hypothetical protein K435DRAFT_791090 [Dendrothele bispora CBS 962.96]